MSNLDPSYVKEALQSLVVARVDVFGASAHGFLLNPVLPETTVADFERQHAVTLPPDYRHFLTHVGNGGASPYYGVFPLKKMDGLQDELQNWVQGDGIIGTLSEPFSLSHAWNDLATKPTDELLERDEQEYERLLEQFGERYFSSSLVNGAIPICHEGCALRIWLVITGPQSGRLWRDTRSEYGGLTPLHARDGTPASFSVWYREWLEDALAQPRISCSTVPPARRSPPPIPKSDT